MEVFAVVSKETDQVIELFLSRAAAEEIVANWDRDEPERAGELRTEAIELAASTSLS
jgi:hypothetical protein